MDLKSIKEQLNDFELVIFEMDDVIFPRKDYVLQIYYLFCAFIEYMETTPEAQKMLAFMKAQFELHGEEGMFEAIQNQFHIDEKYKERLENLYSNAILPLKLELYPSIMDLMAVCTESDKKIWIVTNGALAEQINKIKQLIWNGIQEKVQVYFSPFNKEDKSLYINNLLIENKIAHHSVLSIGHLKIDEEIAEQLNIKFALSLQL